MHWFGLASDQAYFIFCHSSQQHNVANQIGKNNFSNKLHTKKLKNVCTIKKHCKTSFFEEIKRLGPSQNIRCNPDVYCTTILFSSNNN